MFDSSVELRNAHQKIQLKCLCCGVSWSPTYASFVNAGKGCPMCAGQYRYSDVEYIERINQVGQVNKFKFSHKAEDSKLNMKSRVYLICDICTSAWDSSLSNILSNKYSCPNCARRGFNPLKRSLLYFMSISDNKTGERVAIKYGITNTLTKRMRNLSLANIEFLKIEIIASWGYEDGFLCKLHEKLLAEKFPSYLNKLIMPDGYTETFNPNFLQEAYTLQCNNYVGVQTGNGTSGTPVP